MEDICKNIMSVEIIVVMMAYLKYAFNRVYFIGAKARSYLLYVDLLYSFRYSY